MLQEAPGLNTLLLELQLGSEPCGASQLHATTDLHRQETGLGPGPSAFQPYLCGSEQVLKPVWASLSFFICRLKGSDLTLKESCNEGLDWLWLLAAHCWENDLVL